MLSLPVCPFACLGVRFRSLRLPFFGVFLPSRLRGLCLSSAPSALSVGRGRSVVRSFALSPAVVSRRSGAVLLWWWSPAVVRCRRSRFVAWRVRRRCSRGFLVVRRRVRRLREESTKKQSYNKNANSCSVFAKAKNGTENTKKRDTFRNRPTCRAQHFNSLSTAILQEVKTERKYHQQKKHQY